MSTNTTAAIHPFLSQAKGNNLRGAGEAITQLRSGLLGWDNLGYLIPPPAPPRMLGDSSLANALNTCLYTVGGDELVLNSESQRCCDTDLCQEAFANNCTTSLVKIYCLRMSQTAIKSNLMTKYLDCTLLWPQLVQF